MTVTTEVNRRDALALIAGTTSGLLVCTKTTPAQQRQESVNKLDYDAVIVGGGPSGLSAALVLGRSCRKVLVCDEGKPRNQTSPAVHSYFSRDGISPGDLLKIGREQLQQYAVDIRNAGVVDADRIDKGFKVQMRDGSTVTARKLILATGVKDELPEMEGLRALWGTGVLHCPYCHGWENRNKPWAYCTKGENAVDWGSELLGWTKDLTYCSNGPSQLSDADRQRLAALGIRVREERISKLAGDNDNLKAVHFEGGGQLHVDALFLRTTMTQRSTIPQKLGCKLTSVAGSFTDVVETDQFGATSVPGLYVVGDASFGAPQVATAVSDGALAAIMANKAMLKEETAATSGT